MNIKKTLLCSGLLFLTPAHEVMATDKATDGAAVKKAAAITVAASTTRTSHLQPPATPRPQSTPAAMPPATPASAAAVTRNSPSTQISLAASTTAHTPTTPAATAATDNNSAANHKHHRLSSDFTVFADVDAELKTKHAAWEQTTYYDNKTKKRMACEIDNTTGRMRRSSIDGIVISTNHGATWRVQPRTSTTNAPQNVQPVAAAQQRSSQSSAPTPKKSGWFSCLCSSQDDNAVTPYTAT